MEVFQARLAKFPDLARQHPIGQDIRDKERLEAPCCHFWGGAAECVGHELTGQEARVLNSTRDLYVVWIIEASSDHPT
jgi:hypothetical protein